MSVLTFKSDEFKTFPQILKEYAQNVSFVKGNSEKTVCEYLLDLRTFFRYIKMTESGTDYSEFDFERIGISDLSIEDIRRVTPETIISFLVFTGYELENNTTTRMRKLSALRSFYHFAYVKKHWVDSNPTTDIESPKKAKTLPKYMNVDESVRLLEVIKNDTESKTVIRDFAIVTLFLNTGMRLSELAGLNLKSFDSHMDSVKVLGKGNKERIIYLNDAARNAAKDYLKIRLDPRFISTSDDAFFLSKRQKRISVKTIQWMVYKYLDMAGLGDKGLSVHKLRHTAATLMYQTGKVDIRILKEILGHEQLNTTQIYTHVTNENLSLAMDKNPLADVKIKRKIKTETPEDEE